MHIASFVTLLYYAHKSVSLLCIQCDRRQRWYSPKENEKAIERCQLGLIRPTKCLNASATHCILSYYRRGLESKKVITERRCGSVEDISGCTLYKSSRKMRHLIGNDQSLPKRQSVMFVEVCVDGCKGDNCILNSAHCSYCFDILLCLFLFHLFSISLS
ncbi:hypothetical protein Tcan_06640 [Toxocara canis]|uniref:Uncharacterized protein n=1 Tax=Toxocara canis TaxID=6265 RepID=A0A0B2UYG9_TOXCA|nr:hypothetical protein Tcan_06640 [Toxocara canis]